MSWFADTIHESDRAVLSIERSPSSSDQQVLEALALLVALREWSQRWKDRRIVLSVRTDNVAALTMICKMQPHTERMGIVARELALDIAQSSCSPDDAVHIPGIANKAADVLSRLHQPCKFPPSLPDYLTEDLCLVCETRPRTWWKTLPTL